MMNKGVLHKVILQVLVTCNMFSLCNIMKIAAHFWWVFTKLVWYYL